MHYKNGREAHDGDAVVGQYNGRLVVGNLVDTWGTSETCNGTIIRAVGPPLTCASTNALYHAEDAFGAAQRDLLASTKPPESPAPKPGLTS